MEVDVLGRVIERILIVLIAGGAIAMGWNLFRVGILDPQATVIEKWGFKIKFLRVGPGVLFAFFGATILSIALANSLSISSHQEFSLPDGLLHWNKVTNRQYFDGRTNEDVRETYVHALNTVLHNVSEHRLANNLVKDAQLRNVAEANKVLLSLRDELILEKFGPLALEAWRKYGDAYRADGEQAKVPSELQPVLKEVEPWFEGRLQAEP